MAPRRFRAWHISRKQMYAVGRIDFPRQQVQLADPDNLSKGETICGLTDIVLMQSTGLKIRGIEIFEGDVLANHRGEKAEVIWHERNARWAVNHGNYPKALYRWARNTGTKVIGKKWQHPYLLPS